MREIVAQHGIFAEQARGLFSFAHLTFQEYFAARYIADSAGSEPLDTLLATSGDDKWHEVSPATASLLADATAFLARFEGALRRSSPAVHNWQPGWPDRRRARGSRPPTGSLRFAILYPRLRPDLRPQPRLDASTSPSTFAFARPLTSLGSLDLASALDLDLASHLDLDLEPRPRPRPRPRPALTSPAHPRTANDSSSHSSRRAWGRYSHQLDDAASCAGRRCRFARFHRSPCRSLAALCHANWGISSRLLGARRYDTAD